MHLRRTLSAASAALVILVAAVAHAEAPEIRVEGLTATSSADLERALAPSLTKARPGSLTVNVDGDRATVTFAPKAGATITRTLVLTGDEAERTRAVVWLAENLSRDEAAELDFPTPPSPTTPPVEPPKPAAAPPSPRNAEGPDAKAKVVPAKPRDRGPCDEPMPHRPVSFAIVSPLAYPAFPARTNAAIALGYGQFGAVDGAALGLFVHTRCDVRGVSVASFIGVTGRDVEGANLAILSVVGGDSRGVGVASTLGLYGGDVTGATLGIANLVRGAPRGLLLGAGLNAHGGTLEGASIGTANLALGDVEGTQIGVANIARRVHGLQLGVVNVAEEADAAVGVLSLSWARPFRAAVHASVMRPLSAGVIFEGGRTFSEIGIAWSRRLGADRDRAAIAIDAGVHVLTDDNRGMLVDLALGVDAGVGADLASEGGGTTGRLGVRVGYRVARRFAPQLEAGVILMPESPSNPVRIVPDFGGSITF